MINYTNYRYWYTVYYIYYIKCDGIIKGKTVK